MRFALLEAKLALSNIVRKFNLIPSTKTNEPLDTDPKSVIAYPQGRPSSQCHRAMALVVSLPCLKAML